MELTFCTARLREICEKRDAAISELGYTAARELEQRLADIVAFDTVAELAQMLGDLICDKGPTQKSIRLEAGFEVTFVSGHPAPKGGMRETTDWAKTSRMKIVGIGSING